jgi:hypothetical protein
VRAVAREREVGIPRHRGDGALEEGVRVVQEAGMARVLERGEAAAGHVLALEGEHLEAGLAQVGLQDQPVVAGAEDDSVVGCVHRRCRHSIPKSR